VHIAERNRYRDAEGEQSRLCLLMAARDRCGSFGYCVSTTAGCKRDKFDEWSVAELCVIVDLARAGLSR